LGPVVGFNYGESLDDEAFDIIMTQDSGYVLVGRMNDYDMGIVKTDENGTEEWHTIIPVQGEQMAYSVVEIPDEGYLFTGLGGWLAKVDEMGNNVWKKNYNVALIDNIVQSTNGNFFLGGYTANFPGTDYFWLEKINKSGETLWYKIFNKTSISYCSTFKGTSDGGFIFLGLNNTNYLIFLKIDVEGVVESEIAIQSTFERATLIKEDSDGWILAGDAAYPDESFVITKFTNNGTIAWSQSFYNNNHQFGTGMVTNDGGYLMTGTIWYEGNYDKIWTIKTDPKGLHQWNKTYSGGFFQNINGIIQTEFGYALVGAISFKDNDNFYFILTDINGKPLYTLSEEVTSTVHSLEILSLVLAIIILKIVNKKKSQKNC
jgi:hypothetical protein